MPHVSDRRRAPLWLGSIVATGLGACVTLSLCAAHAPKRVRAPVDDSFNPSVAQQVVESGDTLWDITEKVTGKPWLWARVWAMNPEITNPHWLYPGDIVRFQAPTELPPSRADLVASAMEIPQATDAAVDRASQGPKVEVINTAPPPTKQKREFSQRVYDGIFVTTQELADSGKVTNAIPDKILLRQNDLMYLTFPKQTSAKAGDKFYVYRTVRRVDHPVTHKGWGYMTEITGVATVLELDHEVARARLDNAVLEVERGQHVTPMVQDLLVNVGVVPAKAEVRGVILAVEGDRVTASEQALVFVDKGKDDGLERGNQLKVRQLGDDLGMARLEHPPDIDVATLVVVDAKDHAATCLVVESLHELWAGDLVRTVGAAR